MPIDVYIHNNFLYSNRKTKYYVDYTRLKGNDLNLLNTFIAQIKIGIPLVGRNKVSWYDHLGNLILSYFKHKILHYHPGIYNSRYFKNASRHNIRILNPNGLTSSAIIHYKFLDPDSVLILAYSIQHRKPTVFAKMKTVLSRRSNNGKVTKL